MSVPQPWPRRRPLVPAVLTGGATLNGVLAVAGIVQDGLSLFRCLIALGWLAMAVVLGVVWRRQWRRFDEETAELARRPAAAEPPPTGSSSA